MQKLLLTIDGISTLVGKAFAWLIVALTLLVCVRGVHALRRSTIRTPGSSTSMNMMYGTLFMMAGAYTLAQNGHVRGDLLYGFFRPRTQATLDLVLYIVFFLPGIVALV